MNTKNKLILILPVIFIVIITGFLVIEFKEQPKILEESSPELIHWTDRGLFKFFADPNEIVIINENYTPLRAYFELKPELSSTYEKISKSSEDRAVFVVPVFTASAYGENGFYEFYQKKCDESCLTVKILSDDKFYHNSSNNGKQILELLGYEMISDIDIDKDPKILQKYDKVILLHNEYVTKSMFDAITNHSKVVYLYPNALYAEISVDYDLETISLIRGHNYPENEIKNGFGWEFDNTPLEFDDQCLDWEFYEITNGVMLNCYPENLIWTDELFLKTIKEL